MAMLCLIVIGVIAIIIVKVSQLDVNFDLFSALHIRNEIKTQELVKLLFNGIFCFLDQFIIILLLFINTLYYNIITYF